MLFQLNVKTLNSTYTKHTYVILYRLKSTYPSFVNCRLRPIHPHGRGFIKIFSSCI